MTSYVCQFLITSPVHKCVVKTVSFHRRLQYVMRISLYLLERVSAADQIGCGGYVARTQATPFSPSEDIL